MTTFVETATDTTKGLYGWAGTTAGGAAGAKVGGAVGFAVGGPAGATVGVIGGTAIGGVIGGFGGYNYDSVLVVLSHWPIV